MSSFNFSDFQIFSCLEFRFLFLKEIQQLKMIVYILKKFEACHIIQILHKVKVYAFTHLHPLSCSVAYTALTHKIHVYANAVKNDKLSYIYRLDLISTFKHNFWKLFLHIIKCHLCYNL